MKNEFYPLQFTPILKERIWGGTKLGGELNKELSSEITGESWEISTVKNEISIVANGKFAGRNLNELIDDFPEEILGTEVVKRFGKEFPLLFKFIDAREDLSIQVHPNDELAKKRHNSFGKTEMWYVMQADPGSRIIVGFKEKSSPEEYLGHLENKSLVEILDAVPAKSGDVFFLETGTVHAIGAGILLAEIQQTSDITYRVYDWDRVDAEGNSRELHIEQALDAINYDVIDTYRSYSDLPNMVNQVVDCPYFTTGFLPLDGKTEVTKSGASFTVYMCVEGDFEIQSAGESFHYKKGDTVLLPAALQEYTLAGVGSLLEISIS
ncbi:MAG TPA: type I phosphomannose isomerase catalytic subunit [Flavobacterium sp.]|jgi:mannose-6-phosphate isomerase